LGGRALVDGLAGWLGVAGADADDDGAGARRLVAVASMTGAALGVRADSASCQPDADWEPGAAVALPYMATATPTATSVVAAKASSLVDLMRMAPSA
jgi:hypothetical protein